MENEKSLTEREKSIVGFLEKHPEGVDVNTISERVGATRQTVAKDLDVLRWKGDRLVVRRRVGTVNLYYHRKFEKNSGVVDSKDAGKKRD